MYIICTNKLQIKKKKSKLVCHLYNEAEYYKKCPGFNLMQITGGKQWS